MMSKNHLLIGLVLVVISSCNNTPKDIPGDYFNYKYEKVFDYYVIEAWRSLDETVPAYTNEMVRDHTQLLLKLPWVKPGSIGDENGKIGRAHV